MPAERVAMRSPRDHSFEVFRRYFNARSASAGHSRLDGSRDWADGAQALKGQAQGRPSQGRGQINIEALVHAIAAALAAFTAQECLNFFAAAGYDSA